MNTYYVACNTHLDGVQNLHASMYHVIQNDLSSVTLRPSPTIRPTPFLHWTVYNICRPNKIVRTQGIITAESGHRHTTTVGLQPASEGKMR